MECFFLLQKEEAYILRNAVCTFDFAFSLTVCSVKKMRGTPSKYDRCKCFLFA
jgi:hypothetical protein